MQMELPLGVVTFKNHPSEVLRPNHPIHLLSSPEHKQKLLEKQKVDFVLALPFTEETSKLSAEAFLSTLHEKLPFRTLILGFNALLGNDRLGNVPELHRIGKTHNFTVEHVNPFLIDNAPVSSSRIRAKVQTGELEDVEQLLGRKYSVYGKVENKTLKENATGYRTASLSMKNVLCPLFGVYAVTITSDDFQCKGVANLGFAPTYRHDHHPLLEVLPFHDPEQLQGCWIEVQFDLYLRPEQVFATMDELKQQIAQDIEQAKQLNP